MKLIFLLFLEIFARTCNKQTTFCLLCDKEQFNVFVDREYVANATATTQLMSASAVTVNSRLVEECRGRFGYNEIVDGYTLEVPLGKRL